MRMRRGGRSRRGKVLIMTALLVPVLFGATLVSTDTAVLVNAEAQLKTSADAAALAGAMALVDGSRVAGATDLSALITSARYKALEIGGRNRVLGATLVFGDNPSNASTGDVVIGYLAPTDYSSSAPSTGGSQAMYNSVKVTATRDANHGGQIATFFGGPLGIGGRNLSVSSTASARNYSVQGLKSVRGANVNLLPVTLDKATYDAMLGRTLTADQYTYNAATGAVSPGPDGVPESQFFPVGVGNPGNFGTVNIGNSSSSTTVLENQIRYGVTAAQLATYPNGTIQLDTSLRPPSITLSGSPGISAGMKDALISQIGSLKVIPIYDVTGSNGTNSTYRIVGFGAVRIMSVNFSGSQKYVLVQPALMKDPSLVPGTVQSSWTNGGAVRVYLSR